MFPYRVVSIALSCFSFVLFLLSSVCPHWLLLTSDMGTLHFGIWSVCTGSFCKGLPPRSNILDASRGFVLLGLIFAFVATLCCFDSFLRQASKFFPETNVPAMSCFSAGALGLIGSVMFLLFEIHSSQHPDIKRSYNWAFYLSWAVGPAYTIAVFPGLAEKVNLKQMTKVMSCLSLLTELLALVTPYWLEFGSPGFETTIGLWNICLNWFCTKLPMGTVAFEVVKGLMTLSTLLGFIAVCSVLTSFHPFRKYRLAAITNSLTGLCALASVLTFRICFTKISEPFHPEMSPRRGWSFYVGCLASFLFLASALVSLIAHLQCPETPLPSRSQVSPQQEKLQPQSPLQPPPCNAQPPVPPPE